MSKVILAIDDSEHSKRAFDYYSTCLHKPENEVIIVQAVEPPYISSHVYMDKTAIQETFERAKFNAKVISDKYAEYCRESQIRHCILSDFGRPGEFIVYVAKEKEVMMIVMGSRGLGTLRRTMMGSVSEYVVHHAHCPVVVVKPEK